MNIITGFHRSGTSCIAGALYEAGVHMGPKRDMVGESDSNKKGHFENEKIVEINDSILSANYSRWDKPISGRVLKLQDDTKTQINGFIEKYGQGITVKDPRFCVTMGIWRANMDSKIGKVLIVIRNPADCVNSLYKRNKLANSKAFKMWIWYMHELVNYAANEDRMTVEYEAFLTYPKEHLKSILGFLGFPELDSERMDRAAAFADAALRHNKGVKIKTPKDVENFYQALKPT